MSVLHLARLTLSASGVRDVYDLHRLLWKAFPGVPSGTAQPFLFRADRVRGDDDRVQIRVLIQSEREPDFSAMREHLLAEPERSRHGGSGIESAIREGARLRFYLRANVTRSVKNGAGFEGLSDEERRIRRGKRVAVWGEEKQREWLLERAERLGFAVCQRQVRGAWGTLAVVHELRLQNVRPWHWTGTKGVRATHQGVDFEGVLEVRDVAKLRETLRRGIGPAKAFGFGLLSLARENAR